MADWSIQKDSQLDPDAPLTSELAYGWRDNLIAVTEGAPGAPRITNLAHPEFYIGSTVIDYVTPWGIDVVIGSNPGGGGSGTDFGYYWSFTAMRPGAVRIAAKIKVSDAGQTARFAVFRNGVFQAELTSNSTTNSPKGIDQAFDAGDQIMVRGGLNYTGAGGTAWINSLLISADRRGVYRT